MKIKLIILLIVLSFFASGCVIEDAYTVRSYYPYYYNYYVRPAPKPVYRFNPYAIPPRCNDRHHHNCGAPVRSPYNYRPAPKPTTPAAPKPIQTKPAPSGRGPSPYRR